MGKKSFLDKILLFFNGLFALALALSLLVPYLPESWLPSLSVLSLLVPFLVIPNLIFAIFWVLRGKMSFLVSAIPLVLWYVILGPFYRISRGHEAVGEQENTISIMSFNARGFNEMGQLKVEGIDSLIYDFVTEQDPDIVCFQESFYALKRNNALSQYPYKFVDFVYGKHSGKVIQSIYSKYPILNLDSIVFPNSANTAIFADLLIDRDTIRVYNVHLQSFRIVPSLGTIKEVESSRLLARSKEVIAKQSQQAVLIRESMDTSPYRKVLAGDFNNTQYSKVYRLLKGDMNDSYKARGKGFGKTFDLLKFPIRIDYIMADPEFEILEHHNFDVELSDHFPVLARLRLDPSHQ